MLQHPHIVEAKEVHPVLIKLYKKPFLEVVDVVCTILMGIASQGAPENCSRSLIPHA